MIRFMFVACLSLGFVDLGEPGRADGLPKTSANWPLFGGSPTRNMVNLVDKNVPVDWSVEEKKEKNVKWKASLGSKTYAGPVIAGGRIFVGTNGGKVRTEKKAEKGDKLVLMCLRESDGQLLWQVRHDAPLDPIFDHVANMGLLSTPTVDGERIYYVLSQCLVICADAATGKPVWQYDMHKELKVVPFHCSNCSPLVVGNLLYLVTGNGVDEQTGKVRDKDVPSFIAMNKNTGKLVWASNLPGDRVIEGQWSNPSYAVIRGKPQVIFAGGDAAVYSFEPETGKLIWKCSCLPKPKAKAGNAIDPYIISTPVIHDDKVYVGLGVYPGGHPKFPRHSFFLCIDATRTGDVSPGSSLDPKAADNKNSAVLWSYGGVVEPRPKASDTRRVHFGCTISTCAVHDGLVYITEEASFVHCLDARTGEKYWMEDLRSSVWRLAVLRRRQGVPGNRGRRNSYLPGGQKAQDN